MPFKDKDIIIRIKARNLTKGEIDKARRQLDGLEKKAGAAGKSFSPLRKEVKLLSTNFASMNPATASASRLLGGMNLAALGSVGAVACLAGAAAAGVGHVIKLGDQITTLSSKTGLSTDFLQELNHAANQLDVPFETAANAISKLQVNLGKATASKEMTDALDQMGLSIENLRDLRPEDQFEQIAGALAGMKNQTEQAAAAQAVFGRGGVELLPLLRGNYAELMDQAQELGIVLSQDLLEAGDELGESWELLKTVGISLLAESVTPLTKGLVQYSADLLFAIKQTKKFIDELEREQKIDLRAGEFWRLSPDDARARAESEFRIREDVLAKIHETADERARANKIEADLADAAGKVADAYGDQIAAVRALHGPLDDALRKEERRFALLENLPNLITPSLAFAEQVMSPFQIPEFERGDPFGPIVKGIGDANDATEEWEKSQLEYNEALAGAADLVQIIGGDLGRLVGQTLAAGAALQNLSTVGGSGGILGGLDEAFKGGKGKSTGILGFLGGVGGLAGAAGPLIGLGTSLVGAIAGLFGRDAEDVAKDVGRDIGVSISDGLAESILQSGENAQLFLREIWTEGALGIDELAREVGDFFSMFERGEISQPVLVRELKETIPILIENFHMLGAAGQAEIERIKTAPAPTMGVELTKLRDGEAA